jgi:hypothetical protein
MPKQQILKKYDLLQFSDVASAVGFVQNLCLVCSPTFVKRELFLPGEIPHEMLIHPQSNSNGLPNMSYQFLPEYSKMLKTFLL